MHTKRVGEGIATRASNVRYPMWGFLCGFRIVSKTFFNIIFIKMRVLQRNGSLFVATRGSLEANEP